MEIVKFENVTFEYLRSDEQTDEIIKHAAIKDFSLSIKKGEFAAVLGHNGSGKSTFAKLINALLIPTEGTVTVNGMLTSDEQKVYAIRETAGMVFQNPDNQLVASVIEEEVAFGPQNIALSPKEIKERVAEALNAVGMSEYAKTPTFALSGGQKQKVAIAGVLAMEPTIIILDEATAMLDPVGRADVIRTAFKLNKEKGITVVFITHFMHEATYADRAIVLENGRIAKDAPPRDVFARPPFLRSLGVDAPQIPDLAHRLKESGFNIPRTPLDIPELVEALCCLK